MTMRKATITYTLTDEDVRSGIEQAAAGLEEENQIRFPDPEAREEFIEDCTDSVLDKFDRYEIYSPDYTAEILDAARLYHYLTD